jgi:membrane fusion protein (multidrug efflux system)
MKKKILLTLLSLLLLIGAIIAVKALQIVDLIASGENLKLPPESVLVAEAASKTWAFSFNTVGTVEAVRGVMVANEVPGKVMRIGFESGARAFLEMS